MGPIGTQVRLSDYVTKVTSKHFSVPSRQRVSPPILARLTDLGKPKILEGRGPGDTVDLQNSRTYSALCNVFRCWAFQLA